MNRKYVYIVRHGETDENRMGIVQGRGIDSSLNEIGCKQAEDFYNLYKDVPFDVIFCSKQRRSYETIKRFEREAFLIRKDERLDEISWGEHEGKGGDPELMEKYYRIINSWMMGKYHDAAHGGESAFQLSERLKTFINELENLSFSNALICTHGRTLRAMICLLRGMPLHYMENIKHQNTGLYVASFHFNQWEILKENDCNHFIKTHSY